MKILNFFLKKQLKILHSPRNPCNIAWVLAEEQRKLGHISHVMKHDDDVEDSKCDYNLKISRYQRWSFRYLTYLFFAIKAILKYDIFIFHTGITLLPNHRDLPVLKFLRKKIFFYFHGREVNPNGVPDHAEYYANHYFVSTPDLFKYAPKATWIPQAIDMKAYPDPVIENKKKSVLTILHAISEDTVEKRMRKGTYDILNTIKSVKSKGYNIKLDLVVATSQEEFINHLQKADIVIDQMVLGWYGVISIEAMFYGKPVLVYISDNVKKYLPTGCPLILTSPEKLENDLIQLIESNNFLYYSNSGPEYVSNNHSAQTLISKINNVIEK